MFNEWFTDFWRVLISPTPNTFKEIAKHAKDKFSGGVVWVLLAILTDRIFLWISSATEESDSVAFAWTLVFNLIAVPLLFIFFSYFLNFIYKKMFNRKKDCHEEVYYLSILIFIPLFFATAVLRFFPPVVMWVTWIILGYQLILLVIAVKTLTHLKAWQALVSVLVSLPLTLFAFICFAAWIPSLMDSTSNLMR